MAIPIQDISQMFRSRNEGVIGLESVVLSTTNLFGMLG